ncbi:MAG: nicotinate-nicotinamide nucleotide adenylyltransferase, partial [bacterium]
SLLDIFDWRQSEYLLENASFIVALRPGFDLDLFYEDERYKPYKDKIHILETVYVDISSTRIRNWVKNGKSIRYQLPESVRKYIKKQNLYRG